MWKQGIFGAVSAAFLGYVAWVCYLSPARHQIEWDVATRVSQILEHSGFARVEPVVDGRDVELRGTVGTTADAARAERIVANLRGVRAVRSELVVGRAEQGLEGGDMR